MTHIDASTGSASEKVKRVVRKVIGQPEDAPETVHSLDYLKGNTGNLGHHVG